MTDILYEKVLGTRGRRKGTNTLQFGTRLRKIMDERRLTVREVAALAAINRSVVQSWISNANPHDLAAVARLAKGLNVGFKELLLGEPEDTALDALVVANQEILFDGIYHLSIKKITSQ